MAGIGSLRRRRRGQATIIGMGLFLILFMLTFSTLFFYITTLNEYNRVVQTASSADLSRIQEDIRITSAYLDAQKRLILNMTNRGMEMAHLTRLWIINQTDNQHYQYDFDNLYLAPGESISNTTRISLKTGKDYTIRIVTEKGNMVSFNLVPQIRARLRFIAESTVVKGLNNTIVLAVTNNDTSNNYIYNLEPTINITPSAGVEYKSGPEPAMVSVLAPGSTAFFQWDYRNTGDALRLTYNGSFVNAPQGNYVLFTAYIKTFLEVSTLGNATLSAQTTSGKPFIAVGDKANYAYLLTGSGSEAWIPYQTGGDVKTTAMSGDGNYAVYGSDDKKIYYFTNSSGTPKWTYNSNNKINAVAASWDGNEVVAGNDKKNGGVIYYFDNSITRSGVQSSSTWSYTAAEKINTVDITWNGTYVAAGEKEGLFAIYFFNASSLTPETPVWTYEPGPTAGIINQVDIADNATKLAAGTDSGYVYYFDFSSNTPEWTYDSGDSIKSMAIADDGSYVVAGGKTNILYLLNSTGGLVWSDTVGGDINSVAISHDANYIVVGSQDKNIYVYKRTSGSPLWQFEADNAIGFVDIASDASFVAACEKGAGGDKVYLFMNDPSSLIYGEMQPLWMYETEDEIKSLSASGTLFPTTVLNNTGTGTIVLSSDSRLVYTDLDNNTYTGALIRVTNSSGSIFRVTPNLDSPPIKAGDTVTLTFSVPRNELQTAPTGVTLYSYLTLRGVDQNGYPFIQRIDTGTIGSAPP